MIKRKQKIVPKNIYVVPALFRKAGAHVKTNKAIRKHEKQNFSKDLMVTLV